MSHYRWIGISTVALLLLASCTSAASTKPAKMGTGKVLLIAQEQSAYMELMLTKEVGVMIDMLEKAGFDVIVASPAGEPIKGSTTTLTPDMKLSDVKVDDYVGVIVPCMGVDLEAAKPPAAIEILKKAVAEEKPIAAQLGGVTLLAAAGALEGKQFAMLSELKDLIYNGIYKGEGVVQDGNIITSGICPLMVRDTGRPDGTTELTQMFIDTLMARQ